MFEFKKLLSVILMPLPALFIIAVLGLFLLWFSRKKITASLLLTLAIIGLFLVSFQPFTAPLLISKERQYPAFIPPERSVDYILVLGNGHVVDKKISLVSSLSQAAVMRLVEGIRIYRMYPESKLILSGYNNGTSISHAKIMAKVALSLGVRKSDILLLENARNTHEEALQTYYTIGDKNLVLVTSASHMPRAMEEFHNIGINPTPAPTNYLANIGIREPWTKYSPQAVYLKQFELFWHEQVGSWYMDVKDFFGAIDKPTEEAKKMK